MKRRRILPYLERLWVTDIALTTLLVFLLAYIFFLYPLGEVGSLRFLTSLFFSVILITGAITASRNRIFRMLVFSWGLLTFIFVWVRYLFPHGTLIFIANCLALFFLVLLTALILGQAFREGPTTSHRIMGAVAAYLLLGLIWSLAYNLSDGIPHSRGVQYPGTPNPRRHRIDSVASFIFQFHYPDDVGLRRHCGSPSDGADAGDPGGSNRTTFPCHPDCTTRFSSSAVPAENSKPLRLFPSLKRVNMVISDTTMTCK
jgi:hypothetical protein